MSLRTAALLAGILLAGCASAPSGLRAPRDEIGDFALEGRFALRVSLPEQKPRSSGGRLAWEHRNGSDRVLISSPLGIGMAEIETSPAGSRLRLADGQTRESADPDALIEEITGQRLPVRQLPQWLVGHPGSNARTERDASGRPLHLTDAGWRIEYAYADEAPGALPSAVTLSRGDEVELRVRIEEWREAP